MKFEWFIIVLISFSFLSFQENSSREQLIKNRLQEKLIKFKNQKLEDCEISILKKANAQVDSILLAKARHQTVDQIKKPPVPIKPNRPDLKLPKDTSPIAPIIE